jgi:hypothetical protein
MARPLRETVLALLIVLAGCASPAPETPPEITFAHLPPISLNVRTIEVTSAYQNSSTSPNVETQLTTPPSQVMQRWANDRLRAVGGTGTARFTVLSAPVTEEPLPKQQGFVGAFTIEPGYRYTITLGGQLEILDDSGQRLAVASARITQSGTLDEGVTPEERQAFWAKLTASAMDSFNAQMERAIYQYLKDWAA